MTRVTVCIWKGKYWFVWPFLCVPFPRCNITSGFAANHLNFVIHNPSSTMKIDEKATIRLVSGTFSGKRRVREGY